MECLLSFCAEYFVSQSAVHKYKGIKIYTPITLPVLCMGVKLGLSH